jgi:hypothetical protein
VRAYFPLVAAAGREAVLALSSGFMTYPPGVHPEYERCRRDCMPGPGDRVLFGPPVSIQSPPERGPGSQTSNLAHTTAANRSRSDTSVSASYTRS